MATHGVYRTLEEQCISGSNDIPENGLVLQTQSIANIRQTMPNKTATTH